MQDLTPEELGRASYEASRAFDGGRKDLDGFLLIARSIWHAALALAQSETDAERARRYRFVARGTAYNIAAACWPGWEDAAPDIGEAHMAIGLAMARHHVDTGEPLQAPPERRANGYWMLGAHLLTQQEFAQARQAFQGALELSEADSDGALMARGWLTLCDLLEGVQGADAALNAIKRELEASGDDGRFYAAQFGPVIRKLRPDGD
jgi:tetratricopeptide (TPR) repeat protein